MDLEMDLNLRAMNLAKYVLGNPSIEQRVALLETLKTIDERRKETVQEMGTLQRAFSRAVRKLIH